MSQASSSLPETPAHALEQIAPRFDLAAVETPAFVVDLGLLEANLQKLALVQRESGAKVLLALKGFSMFSTFRLVRQYLSGCCASGLHEALLAHEEFGQEVHVYAPAFKEHEMRQIIPIADHISFNSMAQWRKFRPMIEAARARGHAPSPGLRVNPEHSEVEVALYDPCSPGCRLGTRAESLDGEDMSGLEGLHFHALCEQGSDVLERTLAAVERRFPKFLEQVKWVNMGGGHHITRSDYDTERLIRVVSSFKQRWGKEVYLEPGEAVALNTGYLVASVMDVVGESKPSVAIKKPKTTLHYDHQDSTSSFPYRAAGDARGAARELYRRLKADLGADDRANAAERIHAETQSLRAWAQESGRLISPTVFEVLTAGFDSLEGGSEHDVLVDHQATRVIKLTLPPNFGARGDATGYLENLLAYDALIGFDWRLEGVLDLPEGLRLLTSQPFVVGEKATDEQIEAYFNGQGFIKKRENTFVRKIDGLTIADARPDNIFRDATGAIFPFDIHVLGLDVALNEPDTESAVSETPLPTAILDISATCHMPDTLEMPYRPHIIGGGLPGEFPHHYKLGGMSCLAGDVVSEYTFPAPLEIGQKLVFTDMAHYTMVKTTTFNGVPHPNLVTYDPASNELNIVRRIGYDDFKRKLS